MCPYPNDILHLCKACSGILLINSGKLEKEESFLWGLIFCRTVKGGNIKAKASILKRKGIPMITLNSRLAVLGRIWCF